MTRSQSFRGNGSTKLWIVKAICALLVLNNIRVSDFPRDTDTNVRTF